MRRSKFIVLNLFFVLILAGIADTADTVQAERLPKPTLVSPVNTTHFEHFPRTTTLAWEKVPGATGYEVERQYLSIDTWISYAPVTVTAASYTFDFVGDQPGRWRVTALAADPALNSRHSAWWVFDYFTGLKTPVLVSPAKNTYFDHFPRTTTLAWKPVAFASGYKVEIEFYSDDIWTSYKPHTVTAASYTFDFVGAQPGRWRVTALGKDTYTDSEPSPWRIFVYNH
jgi:hypothetical protein